MLQSRSWLWYLESLSIDDKFTNVFWWKSCTGWNNWGILPTIQHFSMMGWSWDVYHLQIADFEAILSEKRASPRIPLPPLSHQEDDGRPSNPWGQSWHWRQLWDGCLNMLYRCLYSQMVIFQFFIGKKIWETGDQRNWFVFDFKLFRQANGMLPHLEREEIATSEVMFRLESSQLFVAQMEVGGLPKILVLGIWLWFFLNHMVPCTSDFTWFSLRKQPASRWRRRRLMAWWPMLRGAGKIHCRWVSHWA